MHLYVLNSLSVPRQYGSQVPATWYIKFSHNVGKSLFIELVELMPDLTDTLYHFVLLLDTRAGFWRRGV